MHHRTLGTGDPASRPSARRSSILPPAHGALPPWSVADLPAPPPFGLRNVFAVIGPGAIMAATSVGGGEWLVGPAAAVKYSSAIFLIATIAIGLQVLFNLEAIRYTLYTGEPIYGGIMRLQRGPRWRAAFYGVLGFLQLGWPALAGSAAATLLGAWMGRMPGAPDQAFQAWITTGLIGVVVLILSFGGTIERMLEYVAWTMLAVVFLFPIVVVQTYLAHHEGRTLVALANALVGDRMVQRFHADPRVQATTLLLQERVPRQSPSIEPRPLDGMRVAAPPPAVPVRRYRPAHTVVPHTQFPPTATT